MVKLVLGEKTYELATSLRVVYAMKDITGANSLQAAVGSIQHLDLEGQISLLYAAYKAGSGKNDCATTKEIFTDAILDNLGIFAITNAVNALTEGLLYSGMSPEEIAAKKTQVEAVMKETGAASSAMVTD